jgi:hypothetical protein
LADEQDAAQRAARAATAAAALQPPPPGRQRERRRVRGAAALALLVLAVFGFASYEFVAHAGHARRATAAAPSRTRAGLVPASAPSPGTASPGTASPGPASPGPASPGTASPGTASTAPASQSPVAAASPPPRVLAPASVAAFGPGGAADGQNPQNVALAVAGQPASPWYSYVSASPGWPGPTPGTGLLLDMGQAVTVTSVRVSLDGEPGAALQLRAGGKPILSWLPPVATVSGAGGTVLLRPRAPVHVRYVLIWFTQLPPDRAGTYQASVYQLTVKGQP